MNRDGVRDEISAAITACMEDDRDVWEAARDAVSRMSQDAVRETAAAAIVDYVRAKRRIETLDAERRAEVANDLHEGPSLASTKFTRRHYRRNTKAYRAWVESTDEGKRFDQEQARLDEDDARWQSDRWEKMSQLLDQFTVNLRVQWTRELLDSTFALADGAVVSWGAATVDQHRERSDMFTRNAIANAEGAARHRRAVADIEAAGVATLNDLAMTAAA